MIILIVYAYDYVYDYLADVGEGKGLKGVRMGWDEMRGGGGNILIVHTLEKTNDKANNEINNKTINEINNDTSEKINSKRNSGTNDR